MNIAIVGSSHLAKKMSEHAVKLQEAGHTVYLPALDDSSNISNELELMEHNREIIEKSDEVHVFWNQRSPGTWGDWCMAFALRKPVKRIYIEEKTMAGVMELYENYCFKDQGG